MLPFFGGRSWGRRRCKRIRWQERKADEAKSDIRVSELCVYGAPRLHEHFNEEYGVMVSFCS